MAVRSNLKDIGWMYHTAAAPRSKAEITVPPTSQIPGLGNMPDSMAEKEAEPRRGIKETDTPYIVMAKQGGRRDLLRFRENSTADGSPQDYPRCDWFYLEDNLLEEDGNEKEDWQSRLPEYMVTQTKSNKVKKIAPMGRLPFATEVDLPRADSSNKTVHLPELRKPGYGVRLEKAKIKDDARSKHTNIKVSEPYRRQPENEAARPRHYDIFSDPNASEENAHPAMSKLLAFGYGKDWTHARDTYDMSRGGDYERKQRERIQELSEQAAGVALPVGDNSHNDFFQQKVRKPQQQQKSQQRQQQQNLSPWRGSGKPGKASLQ